MRELLPILFLLGIYWLRDFVILNILPLIRRALPISLKAVLSLIHSVSLLLKRQIHLFDAHFALFDVFHSLALEVFYGILFCIPYLFFYEIFAGAGRLIDQARGTFIGRIYNPTFGSAPSFIEQFVALLLFSLASHSGVFVDVVLVFDQVLGYGRDIVFEHVFRVLLSYFFISFSLAFALSGIPFFFGMLSDYCAGFCAQLNPGVQIYRHVNWLRLMFGIAIIPIIIQSIVWWFPKTALPNRIIEEVFNGK